MTTRIFTYEDGIPFPALIDSDSGIVVTTTPDGHNRLDVSTAGANIADNSITEAKLTTSVAGAGLVGGNGTPLAVVAAAAGGLVVAANDVSIKPDVTTGATVAAIALSANGAGVTVDDSTVEHNANALRVKDLGITAAKLAAASVTPAKVVGSGSIAGSIAVPMIATARIADAATEVEIVLPVKCNLSFASSTKRGGAGGAGDGVQLRTATGGGGTLVGSWDYVVAADEDVTLPDALNDAATIFVAGASIFVLGIVGAADNSADITLIFTPIT